MKNEPYLFKNIEDKTITWFGKNNRYVVVENITADIIKSIANEKPIEDIVNELSEKIEAPKNEIKDFILNLKKQFFSNSEKKESINKYEKNNLPLEFEHINYYKVNNIVFKVSYFSEKELSLIHPKFSHLQVDKIRNVNHHFQVFINDNIVFLYVDSNFIGSWSPENVHYFQGKFSMELIQKVHQKEEDKWLGIFHASAISNGEKSILFLGDSGNGKSTSLALLQSHGFTCLADDFVPIDAAKREVYSFPAGISIKKNSLKTLLPIYPELATTAEYDFKRLNKIVRFLKPNNSDFTSHLPCKDLVFIKYEKDAELRFEKISKIEAFQNLVPDSWLSTIKENASIFLDWFSTLHCYQLVYSKNQEMINQVEKLFSDDI